MAYLETLSRRPVAHGIDPAFAEIAAGLLVRRATHTFPRAAFEHVWIAALEDLEARRSSTGEFPMTAMTRALAEAIWRIQALPVFDFNARALDVGVGGGIHALLMALCGYAVTASDINAEAVEYARARCNRLLPRLRHLQSASVLPTRSSSEPTTPAFVVRGVDDDWSLEGRFSLITFNPPAYYRLGMYFGDIPAASGVFVDDDPHSRIAKPQTALLYRFFRKVVLPMLAPGGRVICTWPALERRIVEPDSGDALQPPIVTPDRLLASWFGITVLGGPPDPHSFFSRRAFIADDYGLGGTFRRVFEAALHAGWYSRLVDGGSAAKPSSFRFGVLCLQRDVLDPNLFRWVTR